MDREQHGIDIARNIMRLLDDWGLEGKQIVSILALPGNIRIRHLDKFRHGAAFPNNETTDVRIEHIAGIADALRTTFPRNAHMAVRWLRTPHRRFNNSPPLEIMINSDTGLFRVRSELDCAYAWDQSGS